VHFQRFIVLANFFLYICSCGQPLSKDRARFLAYDAKGQPGQSPVGRSPENLSSEESQLEVSIDSPDNVVNVPPPPPPPSCAELKVKYFKSEPDTCETAEALCLGQPLEVAQIFSDQMVVQRGDKTIVWGKGYPGEFVTLNLGTAEACGITDDTGRWEAKFQHLSAGGPHILYIEGDKGRDIIEKNDVLIGDIWVSSGQSNMYWPLNSSSGGAQVANSADLDQIRFYNVAPQQSAIPLGAFANTVDDSWSIVNGDYRNELLKFSAVSFFFGRKVHLETGVPIGLINAAVGGTKIEPWTPEKEENSAQSFLYNGMINPLIPMNIKGFLWYQGESNHAQGLKYQPLFEKLINNWRSRFKNENLPFYYVQLAAFSQLNFAGVKLAQSNVNKTLKNTGMVVISDVSTLGNIHPPDKKSVGARLALWALAKDYGQKEILYSGPTPKTLSINNNRAILTFDHVGEGLSSRDNMPLNFFEVSASKNGPYYPASNVVISGDRLIITANQVAQPSSIRFGWPTSAIPNLVNSGGLPTSMFVISN